MATRAEKIAALIEKDRRGNLVGVQKVAFDDNVRRGRIALPTQQPALQQQPAIPQQAAPPEELAPLFQRTVQTLAELPAGLAETGRGIAELVTGGERRTERAEQAPEIFSLRQSFAPDSPSFAEHLKLSARLLLTMSPEEQAKIIKKADPTVKIEQDEKGNTFAIKDGKEFVINRPGISAADAFTGIATLLSFVPAARAAGIATTVAGRIGLGATAAAATQTGIETVQATGGGEFDATEIALSLGLGAGAEALSGIARAAFSRIKGKEPPVDLFDEGGNLTTQGRSALKEANITEEQLKSSLSKLRQELNVPEQLRLERAKRFGIDLRQSKLSRDFELQQQENILLSSAGRGGADAKVIEQEGFEQIKNAQDKFLQSLDAGKKLSRAERGQLIKQSVKDLSKEERAAVSELYTVAEELGGGETLLNTERILDISENEILQLPVEPRVITTIERALAKVGIIGKDPKKVGRFTTVVNDDGQIIKFKGEVEPLTIRTAEKFRKSLNKIVSNDDTGAVLNIVRGLDDQIEETLATSAEQAGDVAVSDAFKRARATFKEFRAKFSAQDVIADLTAFKRGDLASPKIEASEAITTLLRGEKKIENIRKLKRILTGPNANAKSRLAFNNLKTETIGDIFKKSLNLNEAGAINSIGGKKLNNAITAFGDDALKELLGTKQLNALKELQKTIGDATFQVPRAENTSGTAAALFRRLGNIFLRIPFALKLKAVAVGTVVGVGELLKIGTMRENLKLLKGAPTKTPSDIVKRNRIILNILIQLGGKEVAE